MQRLKRVLRWSDTHSPHNDFVEPPLQSPPIQLRAELDDYLASHTPPSDDLLDRALAYHGKQASARWDTVLDLGCGAGQLSLLLSQHFQQVFARDPSVEMVALAELLCLQSTEEELSRHGLPKPIGVISVGIGSDSAPQVPSHSIDCIIAHSSAHLWNWKDARDVYRTLAAILRPGGSLIILGSRPLALPIGCSDSSTSALFRLTRTLPQELQSYQSQAGQIGFDDLYSTLPKPWEVASDEGWDEQSHDYWVSEQTQDMMNTTKWSPFAIAAWLRTTQPYQRYLAAHPQERARASLNTDLAAVLVQRAAAEDNVAWHQSNVTRFDLSVLWAIRRRRRHHHCFDQGSADASKKRGA